MTEDVPFLLENGEKIIESKKNIAYFGSIVFSKGFSIGLVSMGLLSASSRSHIYKKRVDSYSGLDSDFYLTDRRIIVSKRDSSKSIILLAFLDSIFKINQRKNLIGNNLIDLSIEDYEGGVNNISLLIGRDKEEINRIFIKINNSIDNYKRYKEKKEKSYKNIEDPLKILKIRYVKGEITKEQYEEMRKTIE
jgi:hypothetical protein